MIRRQILDRALSTLPEDLRITLVLCDIEGLEYREIADILEIRALFMTVWRLSTRSAENSCGIRQS